MIKEIPNQFPNFFLVKILFLLFIFWSLFNFGLYTIKYSILVFVILINPKFIHYFLLQLDK